MKRIPLILGSILLAFILIIMISPKTFAPQSPYTVSQIRFLSEDGHLDIEAAPYPPSSSYILGSDSLGRDIFSYIIYGTRLTILLGVLIAVFQFLIGIPMALFAGFGNKFMKSIILQQSIMFSAIPALLISIILLKLDYFGQLGKQNSVIAFVTVLTIVGWPKVGLILMERVEAINSQAFIKGAVAIGKKRKDIALTNVLPHLAPEVIVLFFMEIARNLSMIMQLGVFGVFVGNLKIIKDSTNGILTYYDVSFEPEWSSLLATSRTYISVAPWAVLFPALAFFISVLAFNLFGEGLRQLLQEKDSKVLVSFREFISIKTINNNRMKLIKVLTTIGLILLVIFVLNVNDYKIEKDDTINLEYESVIIGTNERDEVVSTITNYMKTLNIEPLEGEDYVLPYFIEESYVLRSQMLTLYDNPSSENFEAAKDFQVLKYSNMPIEGVVYNGLLDDLYNIKDYSVYEDKFILLNSKFYSEDSITFFTEDIADHVDIKGVLLLVEDKEVSSKFLIEKSRFPVVQITSRLADIMLANDETQIIVEAKADQLDSIGKNIVGIYHGTDAYLSDEVIMIGMNYNYLNDSNVLRFNMNLMNKLTSIDNNKRSIMFMFVDGTLDETYNGIHDVADEFPYSSQKIKTYIDLTGLEVSSFESLKFSNKQAPITRPFPWSVGHHLEEELGNNYKNILELDSININGEYYFTEDESDNMMFWDKGIASIIISCDEKGNNDIYELGEIILEVISLNNY